MPDMHMDIYTHAFTEPWSAFVLFVVIVIAIWIGEKA